MAKRVEIIIAEPSAIIRGGLSSLLRRAAALDAHIIELSDINDLGSRSYDFIPNLLIVNPSYLGPLPQSQLKADVGNEQLKIIALQSALTSQGLLQGYDATISIYDGAESIVDKILEIVANKEEEEVKKDLSAREKEIIVGVVKGMTNKQIADDLCLSTHTVIAHRRNIASKLQIHSPSGLTIYAIVNKLVDLADIKNSL